MALSGCDAVIVQHEYGIYPGLDGSRIVDLAKKISVPIIVVAHTVLSEPSVGQRTVLRELCDVADTVVVMTEVARRRLVHHYGVSCNQIVVIPHGAAVHIEQGRTIGPATTSVAVPLLLTWGLLGPGKGIEWAIDAVARLDLVGRAPQYLVAGATHPNVRARSGESYRTSLRERATELGIADQVQFDDTYRSVADLTALITTADLVVLPYDSVDQVTSGVLVDAVAAGRPVVSTAFPHAIELLSTGAGIVVPQRDPKAMAEAIETVLNDPDRAASMAAEARRLAPSLSWPSVADRYLEVAHQLCRIHRSVAS